MTAEKKALSLVNEFYKVIPDDEEDPQQSKFSAKACALICLKEMKGMLPAPNDEWHEERLSYLNEVEKELYKILR